MVDLGLNLTPNL